MDLNLAVIAALTMLSSLVSFVFVILIINAIPKLTMGRNALIVVFLLTWAISILLYLLLGPLNENIYVGQLSSFVAALISLSIVKGILR